MNPREANLVTNEKLNRQERSFLSAVLADPELLLDIPDMRPEMFYSQKNAEIFRVMDQLAENGDPIDVDSVIDRLERLGKIDGVGGPAEIYIIEAEWESPTYAKRIARHIQRAYKAREILKIMHQQEAQLLADVDAADEVLADLEKGLLSLDIGSTEQRAVHVADGLQIAFKSWESSGDEARDLGIPMPNPDLARVLNGVRAGELFVVGGRPGSGKSAFALDLVRSCLDNKRDRICFISLEMPQEELYARLLSAWCTIPSWKFRSNRLSQDDWRHIHDVSSRMSQTQLHILDSRVLTGHEIMSHCRRVAKRAGGLDAIFLDYIQLITHPESENNVARHRQIANDLKALRAIAKELACPVVALAQLNRSVEARPGDRPQLSDFRESGAIEQDANVALILHRVRSDDGENLTADNADNPLYPVELCLVKQRAGRTGYIQAVYDGTYCRFVPISRINESAASVDDDTQAEMEKHYQQMAEGREDAYERTYPNLASDDPGGLDKWLNGINPEDFEAQD